MLYIVKMCFNDSPPELRLDTFEHALIDSLKGAINV